MNAENDFSEPSTKPLDGAALADPVIAIVRVERDDYDAIREFHFTDQEVCQTFISSFEHIPETKRVELFTLAGTWDRKADGRVGIVTPDGFAAG